MKIGLVMIVKNEGRCLEKCLSGASRLVDEIYITDTGSTDDTVEIARRFGAHISHFEWINDFAAARNFSLQQSDCDWNLILDADEYLLEGSREDLLRFARKGERLGAIQRRDSYREASGEISISLCHTIRFAPKGVFFAGKVHEQMDSSLPAEVLPLVFDHDGYLVDGKGERNLDILLRELQEDPDNTYILYQIAHTLRVMGEYDRANPYFERFYRKTPLTGTGYRKKGVVSYLYNLLELKKYEDGLGVIEQEKERMANDVDYHFLCGTFYTHAILSDVRRYVGFLPLIERSYLRCLEIGEEPGREGVSGNGSFKAAYNLGVWFEVNGNSQKALSYYQESLRQGYRPAAERIKALGGKA